MIRAMYGAALGGVLGAAIGAVVTSPAAHAHSPTMYLCSLLVAPGERCTANPATELAAGPSKRSKPCDES